MTMSGSTFPGRMGANSNPFGSSGSTQSTQQSTGGIGAVIEEDENDTVSSPSASAFDQAGSFGGDGTFGGPPSSFRPVGVSTEGFPGGYGMGRRTSVSAESLNPNAKDEDWTAPNIPKTEHQTQVIKAALADHTLFSKLDDVQSSQLALAMAPKDVPAKGIKVRSKYLRLVTY